ncbi:MAG: sporulation inhibitor of replication protein SirA [Lysinibacillus sp.]
MRTYSIYKIKNEHISFIFGRERQLLEMLNEYEDSNDSLLKELSYICDEILFEDITRVLIEQLDSKYTHLERTNHALFLEHPIKGKMAIYLVDFKLSIYCEGSRMLDLDLFQMLAKMSERFIAFNKEENECGWLKPMKHFSH